MTRHHADVAAGRAEPDRVVTGARLLSTFPVIPLGAGQVLSIGLTSYAGSVHYGLTADREAMPDVELFGHCITDALAELLEAGLLVRSQQD